MPCYNPGPDNLLAALRGAVSCCPEGVVVCDGGTDGSAEAAELLISTEKKFSGIRVVRLPRNRGKGVAVRAGLDTLAAAGFTHAVTLDADDQHPGWLVSQMLDHARSEPDAVVAGQPVFGPDAPWERVWWRKVSNRLGALETGDAHLGDTLFGLRVYPLAPARAILARCRWARGYDFDTELLVRLRWSGAGIIHIPAPVRYRPKNQGGVSHFRYLRDNLLLAWMHLRLLTSRITRLHQ